MTALVAMEVEATFSPVHGLAGGFLGRAAAQPHQAAREDREDLTEVGREVGVDAAGE